MLLAIGWAVVRSSREPYRALLEKHGANSDEFLSAIDDTDEAVGQADEQLFDRLERYLADLGPPDLDWHFRRHMNNASGLLTFSSSRNHRGLSPSAVEVLRWLAENGPGSYGLVYLHDDEDVGDTGRLRGRDSSDHSNEFRVWRLLDGKLEELDDPFLSPIVPRINLDPSV